MSEQQEKAGRKSRRRGFTLVELLVVIAIIGLLLGILIPVLSKARRQGHRTHCLANLKQLTIAWKMYAGDNEGRLCSSGTKFNDGLIDRYWVADGPRPHGDGDANPIGGTEKAIKDGVLWPYTQMVALYRCKADRTEHLRSYSISYGMGGRWNKQPFRTLGEITSPAGKIVFIDATGTWKWLVGSFDLHPFLTKLEHNNITTRHDGGFNVSFADNHCEYWSWRKPDVVHLEEALQPSRIR